jgi:hypothetical protein
VTLNCCEAPATIFTFVGETLICAAGDGLIVTLAEPEFVAFVCKTAVTVTVTGAATFAGAV